MSSPASSGSPSASDRETAEGPPASLLKPAEVAQRLGVSTSWLYEAAKDGRIPSVRLGRPDGPLRFIEADLTAWLARARANWRPGDSAGATLRRAL
jgi:excisionase family DNA binding protein